MLAHAALRMGIWFGSLGALASLPADKGYEIETSHIVAPRAPRALMYTSAP